MSTLRLRGRCRVLTMQITFMLLVLTIQPFAQTSTHVRTPHSLRYDLTHMPAETGMSVAMFDDGKLATAPMGSSKNDWNDVDIPGAIGHSWSYEGMLSPDGTLAAFPYWEVDPCPSVKNCDVEANRHYFLPSPTPTAAECASIRESSCLPRCAGHVITLRSRWLRTWRTTFSRSWSYLNWTPARLTA